MATTNSIATGTRKDLAVWEQYIACMMNGLSIRKTAEICGIHKNTAFYWRHKVLDALQKMAGEVVLGGIVETDETFFPVSYKGNHKNSKDFEMPRAPRKRGGTTDKRELSSEQVCVSCAVNRTGLSIAKVATLGRISTESLCRVLDGRIEVGAAVVTDKASAYIRFAGNNGLKLVQLKGGRSKDSIYHIQHINSYHGMLKRFMRGKYRRKSSGFCWFLC